MSTRANVVLKESYTDSANRKISRELIFYRHSDGYPEGTLPSLNKFMEWLKGNKIRNNLSQAAGWLVVLGAIEYATIPKFTKEKPYKTSDCEYGDVETAEDPKDWKVGAYEPTDCIHGDIEFLYEIDLIKKKLTVKEEKIVSYEPFKTKWVVVDIKQTA
jgi:hypothetical protein